MKLVMIMGLSAICSTAMANEETTYRDIASALVAERDRVVTCASLIKRYAPKGAAESFDAEMAYGEGQAAVSALVTRLIVGLVDGEEVDMAHAKDEAEIVNAHRLTVCEAAWELAPGEPGSKGIFWDALVEAVGPLLGYFGFDGEERARRLTITKEQLERGRWPDFRRVE